MQYKNLGLHSSLGEVGAFLQYTNVFQIGLQNPNVFIPRTEELNLQAQEWRKSFPDSVLICHAPFITNLFYNEGKRSRETVELLSNHVNICRKYNINSIVVHPGTFGIHQKRSDLIQVAVKNLRAVFRQQNPGKVNILLENLPMNNSLFLEDLEMVCSYFKNVGICLDTNHAYGQGISYENMSKFLSRDVVKAIHLNSVPKGTQFGGGGDYHTHTPIFNSSCIPCEKLVDIISTYPNKIKIMEQYSKFALKSFQYLINFNGKIT